MELDFAKCFPFKEARPLQEKIVSAIHKSFNANNYVIGCFPTAIGKSAIGVTLAEHYGPTYFLTSQKTLQEQYMKDFTHLGMRMVKGRSNYECLLNDELKCDMGVCHINKTEFQRLVPPSNMNASKTMCLDCPYIVARESALTAKMTNLNYSYFFNMILSDEINKENPDYVPKIENRPLIICDEAHNLEGELISFMETSLKVNDFKEFEVKNIVRLPDMKLPEHKKFQWLFGPCLNAFQEAYRAEKAYMESMSKDDKNMYFQSRKTKYLDTIVCMINRLKTQLEKTNTPGVCIHTSPWEISFKPLFADKIMTDYLYRFGQKILFMSATIFNKQQFCKNVGLGEDQVVHINCGSPINPKNRPVKLVTNIDLTYKNKEKNKPLLLETVDKILDKHKGERGIIHTVSYDIAKYLVEELGSDRLILPKGKERDIKIKEFMRSPRNDLVLISPSLTEGISLDDDLSRFSIICKLPYKYLGDPWIKKRMELDKKWYNNETVHSLVQMTGRVVRSPDDYGINYILDSHFGYFFRNNATTFPKWWKESLERGEI